MESRNLIRSVSRSLSRSSWREKGVFASGRYSRRTSNVDEDEEALNWAAIERLPTYDRLGTSILQTFAEADHADARPSTLEHREVDVRKLDVNERQEFIDRIFNVAKEDNEKYLLKCRVKESLKPRMGKMHDGSKNKQVESKERQTMKQTYQ